jgi:broad specificity phosphatase PhoE
VESGHKLRQYQFVKLGPPLCAAEIYLVRHGQTVWNACGRFQGAMDSPLTERGRSQAGAVGMHLAEILGPEVQPTLVVSPLGRAQETAALLTAVRSYPSIIIENRIKEVSLGAWDGLTREEIDAKWPNALEGATQFDWHLRAPDCEPFEAALARAQDWLRDLRGTVVAVSHGQFGRIIRGAYLGQRPEELLCLDASPERIWHLSAGLATSIHATEAFR